MKNLFEIKDKNNEVIASFNKAAEAAQNLYLQKNLTPFMSVSDS